MSEVQSTPGQCEEVRKMFVGGLSPETTEADMRETFEVYGTILDTVIIRKDDSKSARLFGFVTYADMDSMDECFLKRPHKINNRVLEVKHAVPKGNTHPGAQLKTKKLFIANLGPKTTEKEIQEYLEETYTEQKYGKIEEVQLIKKKNESGDKIDENKGFGFVTVSSEDCADKWAIHTNKFELGGRTVEMKKSEPKEGGGGGRGGGRGGKGYAQQSGGGGYGAGGYDGYGSLGYGGYGGYGAYGGYGGYGAAGYGYGAGAYGGYGGGYGQQAGRGRGRGGQRYQPY